MSSLLFLSQVKIPVVGAIFPSLNGRDECSRVEFSWWRLMGCFFVSISVNDVGLQKIRPACQIIFSDYFAGFCLWTEIEVCWLLRARLMKQKRYCSRDTGWSCDCSHNGIGTIVLLV